MNAQNPTAALVSSAFVSSRFRLCFTRKNYRESGMGSNAFENGTFQKQTHSE